MSLHILGSSLLILKSGSTPLNLLDMLENRAGQDLTDHIMCYLPDQENAHRMHLVSKRTIELVRYA